MYQFEDARREAMSRMPYISAAILSFTPVAREGLPRLVVSDTHGYMYYDAEGLTLERAEEVVSLICGEAIRMLQNHAGRLNRLIAHKGYGQEMQQLVAQVASDTAVSNILMESNLCSLDPGLVGDFGYKPGDRVEEIYRKILDKFPAHEPDTSPVQHPDTGPAGEEGGRGTPHQMPDAAEFDRAAQKCTEQGKLNHKPQQAGSSIDGIQRPWELPPPPKEATTPAGHGTAGNIRQEPQFQQLADQVRADVAKQIRTMKGRGNVSANLRSWAENQEEHVPIRCRDLASLIRSYGETRAGYHLRRYNGRNRRQAEISRFNNEQFVLPTEHSPKIDITLLLDTSGSMDQRSLKDGVRYIIRVLESLGLNRQATLFLGDCEVKSRTQLLDVRNLERANICGGGGTEMGYLCEQCYLIERESGRHTNLLICVTDGCTGWDPIWKGFPIPLVVALVTQNVDQLIREYPVPYHAHVVDLRESILEYNALRE